MSSTGMSKRRFLRSIFEEQEGECIYCDGKCWLPWVPVAERGAPGRMATREHLVRRADGGNNSLENIAMACADCNSLRNEYTPREWIAMRGGELPTDDDGCIKFGDHALTRTPDFKPEPRTRYFQARKRRR